MSVLGSAKLRLSGQALRIRNASSIDSGMLSSVRVLKPNRVLKAMLSTTATRTTHFQLLRGVSRKVAAMIPAAGQMAAVALAVRKVLRPINSRV